LREWNALVSRALEPLRCRRHVLANAGTLGVARAQVVLRHRLALLGGALEPQRGLGIV